MDLEQGSDAERSDKCNTNLDGNELMSGSLLSCVLGGEMGVWGTYLSMRMTFKTAGLNPLATKQ